ICSVECRNGFECASIIVGGSAKIQSVFRLDGRDTDTDDIRIFHRFSMIEAHLWVLTSITVYRSQTFLSVFLSSQKPQRQSSTVGGVSLLIMAYVVAGASNLDIVMHFSTSSLSRKNCRSTAGADGSW